jgi:hypothetical protein
MKAIDRHSLWLGRLQITEAVTLLRPGQVRDKAKTELYPDTIITAA